jgi:hypothetical protein
MDETQFTTTDIRQLQTEAGQAGDLEMVAICERALNHDEQALMQVALVIANTRAMEN